MKHTTEANTTGPVTTGQRANAKPGSRRWRVEACFASLFGCLTVLTMFVPEWIEALGFEPDGGSGATEWGIVAMLGGFCLAFAAASTMHFVLARRQVASTRYAS